MALPTSRKPAPSNNRWRCPSRPSEKTCWTPRDVPGEGRGGFEVLRRMPHGREQAPVARDSRALAQRVDHEAGRAPRAVGGPQRDVVRAEGPRPAAPVTARAGAGARSGRDRGRGRAWAAARRGRARGRAPGRARADGWAGWDAARPRLCTPLGSRPRPLHEPLKPHLASPPTRSIASGASPRSASGGDAGATTSAARRARTVPARRRRKPSAEQGQAVAQPPQHHEGDDVARVLRPVQLAATALVELLAAIPAAEPAIALGGALRPLRHRRRVAAHAVHPRPHPRWSRCLPAVPRPAKQARWH